MRRLYYRDSYGRIRRGRLAGPGISGGSGTPARFFVTVLMVLAGIVVLASLIPLPASSISAGGPRPGAPALRRSSPRCWRRRARRRIPAGHEGSRAGPAGEHARHPDGLTSSRLILG